MGDLEVRLGVLERVAVRGVHLWAVLLCLMALFGMVLHELSEIDRRLSAIEHPLDAIPDAELPPIATERKGVVR